ncbi:TPA: hypothetical protein ACOBTX_000021 [Enterococcus faecium]
MNKFEVEKRLTEELGGYVHLNDGGKEVFYSEEDYQQLKQFFIEMDKKHKETKK